MVKIKLYRGDDVEIREYPEYIDVLDLSWNELTRIEWLENLVNLKGLYLSNNKLTRLEGLENLVNLEKLYLSNNKLTRIDGMETLVNLETLDLSWNKLTRIEGLENLVNLRALDLSGNKLVIIGSRDEFYRINANRIKIGCMLESIEFWKQNYEEIGREQGYSETEIEEYRKLIFEED